MTRDKWTEEALRHLKISGARDENLSGNLPDEEARSLENAVKEAMAANAPFVAQMLLMGMMISQLLAPHVSKHIQKQNEGASQNTINLTRLVNEEKNS